MKYEVRKAELRKRIDDLENQRDDSYGQMGELEDELTAMNEKSNNLKERWVDYKKKGEILNFYFEYLCNQLLIDELEQYSYSIENFDMTEKDRLIFVLRQGDDIKFNWYIEKKQAGFTFNTIEPLHKILAEDYAAYLKKVASETVD